MCGHSAELWKIIDILRCSGGSVRACEDTSRSPTWISPSEGSRKPAISRSVVVLPQPDGPSRQTSCPWSIFNETLSTTASGPNRLVRPRKSTDAKSPHSHSSFLHGSAPGLVYQYTDKNGMGRE